MAFFLSEQLAGGVMVETICGERWRYLYQSTFNQLLKTIMSFPFFFIAFFYY
jgi:hypothetical protein